MSVVDKKVAVPIRFVSESPTSTGPVSLEVDGVDITKCHVRSIVIESSIGDLSTAKIEMLAMHGLDVTLPAAVTVDMIPLQEGHLDVTTVEGGTLRYRFYRDKPSDA